jgi:hypothetical protein
MGISVVVKVKTIERGKNLLQVGVFSVVDDDESLGFHEKGRGERYQIQYRTLKCLRTEVVTSSDHQLPSDAFATKELFGSDVKGRGKKMGKIMEESEKRLSEIADLQSGMQIRNTRSVIINPE